MTDEQMKALIEKVRKKCYITDPSEAISARVEDMVDDAIISLSNQLGIKGDFDYSAPSHERYLLLNYCFYIWNDSADEFKVNYLDDILQARHRHEVKADEEETENELQ